MTAEPATDARPATRAGATGVTVHQATGEDLADVRTLLSGFLEWVRERYARDRWLTEAYFSVEAWQRELDSLPGPFVPERGGALLIARLDAVAVGTVSLRRLDPSRCEMKRMFVTGAGRGRGIGDRLVSEMITRARDLGYDEMLLDTGFRQHEAQRLYAKHGFLAIRPYYEVDERLATEGLRFMRLELGGRAGQ